jgi:hypothetical protein
MEAAQFLLDLIEAVPYRIHTVLTDNVLCGEAIAALGQQVSARRFAGSALQVE